MLWDPVPTDLGVYVTWQEAVPVVPAEREQLVAGVKLPALSVAKATEPVGVVGEALVSVTVAVHEDGLFTLAELGVQDMDVVVRCPMLT